MNLKRKTIITSLIITMIVILIYIPFRIRMMGNEYVESLVTNSKEIRLSVHKFESNKKLRKKNLSKFFELAEKKYPHIAFIAVADNKKRIILQDKNNSYIKTSKTLDSIIESFSNDEFKMHTKSGFVVRYYDQIRYYVFVRSISGGEILLIYPHKFSRNQTIELILEILLIILISIILTTLMYLYKNREIVKIYNTDDRVKQKKQKEKSTKKEKIKKKKEKEKEQDIVWAQADFFDEYIQSFFRDIFLTYKPVEVVIFQTTDDPLILKKIFELSGETFIKIDDKSFIEISSEIREELKRSSTIILEKGKKITLPIIHNNNLVGVMSISRDSRFVGPDINAMKLKLEKIAGKLNQQMQSD